MFTQVGRVSKLDSKTLITLFLVAFIMFGCSSKPKTPDLSSEENQKVQSHIQNIQQSIKKLNIDRKKFYSSRMKEIFKEIYILDAISEKSGGWQFAYTDKNGQRWFIAEGVWMVDQYGSLGPELDDRLVTFWKEGAEDLIHDAIRYESFINDPTGQLEKAINIAEYNYSDQEKNKDRVKKISLPKEKPIGYISIYPNGYKEEVVLKNMGDDSMMFPLLMNSKGYHFLSSEPIETSSPESTIEKAIQDQYEQGVRYFYLDLNAHGLADNISWGYTGGMYFGNGASSAEVLEGNELTDILNKFHDATFVINSVACFGGDFRKHFESAKLPNASLILQSKPYAYNEEGRLNTGEPDSSYFNLFYHYAIGKMGTGEDLNLPNGEYIDIRTIGDAIRYADLKTGQYMYCNAEVVLPKGITVRGKR